MNGTKGGLSPCTNAGPGVAPFGSVKVKRVELISLIGIFAAPAAVKPPRFTVAPFWLLKKLITVSVENPVPSTVSVPWLE
jgi:hypothetical protein